MIEVHYIWVIAGVALAFVFGYACGMIKGINYEKDLKEITYQDVCEGYERKK